MATAGNKQGQGNDQPSGSRAASPIRQAGESELNIPTFNGPGAAPGAAAAGGAPPVQQAGEGQQANENSEPSGDPTGASMGIHVANEVRTGDGRPVGNEAARIQAGSMADLQQQMDGAAQRRVPPVIIDRYEDMTSKAPQQIVDIPATGRLEDWDKKPRSDLILEPADPATFDEHAANMAFLEEYVVVNIAESNNPADENPVMLSVNGRSIYVTRGEDTAIRRKYLAQLMRSKPQGVQTRVVRDANGDINNRTVKTSALRYPFSMVRDDNPKGRAWRQKILSEV